MGVGVGVGVGVCLWWWGGGVEGCSTCRVLFALSVALLHASLLLWYIMTIVLAFVVRILCVCLLFAVCVREKRGALAEVTSCVEDAPPSLLLPSLSPQAALSSVLP